MRTGDQSRVLNVVSARPSREEALFQAPEVSGPAVIAISKRFAMEKSILSYSGVRCMRNTKGTRSI